MWELWNNGNRDMNVEIATWNKKNTGIYFLSYPIFDLKDNYGNTYVCCMYYDSHTCSPTPTVCRSMRSMVVSSRSCEEDVVFFIGHTRV